MSESHHKLDGETYQSNVVDISINREGRRKGEGNH